MSAGVDRETIRAAIEGVLASKGAGIEFDLDVEEFDALADRITDIVFEALSGDTDDDWHDCTGLHCTECADHHTEMLKER